MTEFRATGDARLYQEVMRNRYALESPLRLIPGVASHAVLGLVFSGLFLATLLGGTLLVFDGLRGRIPTWEETAQVVALGLMFAVLAAWSFRSIWRRLATSLYIATGSPIAQLEGFIDFSYVDGTCSGITIDGQYFDVQIDHAFSGTRFDILESCGGEFRVSFVPATRVIVRIEQRIDSLAAATPPKTRS